MQGKLILSLLLAAALLSGCAGTTPYGTTSYSYPLAGAALGGGVGALSGAAIDRSNPWRGAIVGGLVGGALGGVAGAAVQQSRQPYHQGYPGYGPVYGQYYGPASQTGEANGPYVQEPQPAPQPGSRDGKVAQGPQYRYAY